MTLLNQMNSSELEAFAVKLHAQIDQSDGDGEIAKIEIKDVKDWIALCMEAESCSEPPLFLNLL